MESNQNTSKNKSDQLYDKSSYPKAMGCLRLIYSFFQVSFDKLHSSKFNPVTNAGTLAIYFITLAIISGFYLIFFYKISAPYESIVAIQENAWFTKWVRALHRYTSDASVLCILIHILKMLAHGRSWGPRILSWATGVLMISFLFTIVYTGFVMVWDDHGKVIGILGARMLDLIPLFPESLLRTFSGETEPDSNFFFINVFIHLAIPLGLIVGLWVHTSRISKPHYYLDKKTSIIYLLLFIAVSVIIPAPLLKKADLFSAAMQFPLDGFFSFFLYFSDLLQPMGLSLALLTFTAIILAIPWYWKPSLKIQKEKYVSSVKIELCNGCKQCYYDCPFDAIDITQCPPSEKKSGITYSKLIAQVNPARCVSCGLCAASCSQSAIGPLNRTAKSLLRKLEIFLESPQEKNKGRNKDKKNIFVTCANNTSIQEFSQKYNIEETCCSYNVNCVGSIHPMHLEYLSRNFDTILISGCSPNNCVFRKGPTWLKERIDGNREPEVETIKDNNKILWYPDQETLSSFFNASDNQKQKETTLFLRLFKYKNFKNPASVIAAMLIISGVAGISQLPISQVHDKGLLKLSWKLHGEKTEVCRTFTPEEIKRTPIHMRKAKDCDIQYLRYTLKVNVDERETVIEYKPAGFNEDRPIQVYEEIDIPPGEHNISIEFFPVLDGKRAAEFTTHKFKDLVNFRKDRILLITLNSKKILIRKEAIK